MASSKKDATENALPKEKERMAAAHLVPLYFFLPSITDITQKNTKSTTSTIIHKVAELNKKGKAVKKTLHIELCAWRHLGKRLG